MDKSILNNAIAGKIREILAEKKMSQREFAVKMGKKESEVSRWLSGAQGFTTTTLNKISSVLGVSVLPNEVKSPEKSGSKNIAIILAGGVGSRVGVGKPKQFVNVLGKPILAYTLDAFQKHSEIDAIEVVCVETHIDYLKKLCDKFGFSKVKWITPGGSTFQESVMHGVDNLKGKIGDDDIVLIHYGASPYVSKEIISDGIKVCRQKGNCVSATPCYLLTGSNDNGKESTKWVDRDKIMQLNSPQCFRFEYVVQLYEEAVEKQLLDKVEPHTTSLMYLMGRTIYFSKGDQTNIKITTKEDLDMFEGYALLKMIREQENDKW